jgi:hypothetical protein
MVEVEGQMMTNTNTNSKSRRYLRWLVFSSSTYGLYAFVASILAALISSLIWNWNKAARPAGRAASSLKTNLLFENLLELDIHIDSRFFRVAIKAARVGHFRLAALFINAELNGFCGRYGLKGVIAHRTCSYRFGQMASCA